MMRKSVVLTTFVLALAAMVGVNLVSAQEPQQDQEPTDQRDDQTITVDVDLVQVLFTATDRRGRLYTRLTEGDVRVFEDGIEQIITVFDSETDLPLTIALLIDTSGSIRDKLRFEQEAAIEFFYSTIERNRDKGMLVAFDSGVDLLQDFTDNPETLAEAVRKIRAGGGTSLYDAISLSISEKITQQPEGRRVLIVISDGDDNASRVSLTETLEMAQKNDVVIYAISTNSTANFGNRAQARGDKTLKTFAEETGGKAFFPFKIEDLAVSFADISEELRAQYTLAYIPTNAVRDGTYREIEVRPSDKDFKVKARKGYYAPRDSEQDR